ncbi:MAG: hypothetical protein WCT77_05255 [Bacteroidota bacterium]
MKQNRKILFIVVTVLFIFVGIANLSALTKPQKGNKDNLQRAVTQVFDQQKNTVSNIQFLTTNFGIFGLDITQSAGGGVWPRGSNNQYIYGGGIWFAAKKNIRKGDPTSERNLVELTYNPNSGNSWMVPGRIDEGDLLDQTDIKRHRVYISTDFRAGDGAPIIASDGQNWPIWDVSTDPKDVLKANRYFGGYVADPALRTTTNYSKGPAFISQEDIFATFKDTDLNYFEGGVGLRSAIGYPMKLQFEQIIYSWGFGDYKDFIFLKYEVVNKSTDTLKDCWVAPVMDVDIGLKPSPIANNDRVRFYSEEDSLNLCVQWTNSDGTDKGAGFGYVGFDFLESPAVDSNGFIRKDKKVYEVGEQLGLKTFKNWSITEDIIDDEARYNAMSSKVKDGDNGPGDKRFMMATGPFNFLPGDTCRVVVGLILSPTSVYPDADGSTADVAELVRRDKFAQLVYDNNFRAPSPPDMAVMKRWTPLDCGVIIAWDSTSELSADNYEKGLDFMGYKLYRARRTNLDTFDVNITAPSNQYPLGKGPLGWKQLATWAMPTPFMKSSRRAGTDSKNTSMPFLDSMVVVGPVVNPDNSIDTFSIKVMRIGRGMLMVGPNAWVKQFLAPATSNNLVPFLMGIDTAVLARPWGTFWAKMSNKDDFPIYSDPFKPNDNRHYLLDSVMLGIVKFNRALLPYSPLFWVKETSSILARDTATLPLNVQDTIYFKSTIRSININGQSSLVVDRMIPGNVQNLMKDSLHLRAVLDSVYSYLQEGLAVAEFPNFEQSIRSRFEVILPYMDSITNHRRFYDIGDDNGNAFITYDQDPTKTEKLINNVNYYYRLLSYDEGDYTQPTPVKLNNGYEGLPNVVKTTPLAQGPMKNVDFKVTYIDQDKIGGLYNFRFFGINPDRVEQLFGGHEFELEFQPYWNLTQIVFQNPTRTKDFGLYRRLLRLTDLTTKKVLFEGLTFLEVTPCSVPYRGSFTEDAMSYVLSDVEIIDTMVVPNKVVSFGLPDNKESAIRTGSFTTGDFTIGGYCYSYPFLNEAYGNLGFSFDYSIKQDGGRFRPDTCMLLSGTSTTPMSFLTDVPGDRNIDKVLATQQVDFSVVRQVFTGMPNGSYYFAGYGSPLYGSFNNGPAEYEVEFTAGGDEQLTVSWENGTKTKTFNVPYLNMKVKNTATFNRPGPGSTEVAVTYPGEVQHMFIDVDTLIADKRYYPDPRNLKSKGNEFIDKYNLSGYGFVNARYVRSLGISRARATPSSGPLQGNDKTWNGTQGRYYLTGYTADKSDTIDFCNVFQASGLYFVFDYARKERRWGSVAQWTLDPAVKTNWGEDFKAGDKALLKSFGGALGLPLPGAKVRAKIESAMPTESELTNELLDQIKIVPNPYYISHQGQRSPYDAKIYFTKLPEKCTIDIFTVTGDLIVSLQHDQINSSEPDKLGIQIWDLLSKNRQRVQSQALVAIITSPNGAKTIKKFSVVVGGFRLVPE